MNFLKNNKRFVMGLVLIAVILAGEVYQRCEYARYTKTTVIKYIVQDGDNVSYIAEKFKGKREVEYVVKDIKYMNNVKDYIRPGAQLLIPLRNQ